MSDKQNLKNIHNLAKESELLWPNLFKKTLNTYWQKTLKDDKDGLISMLAILLWKDSINNKHLPLSDIYYLSVAELYFWTAANLEDDLSDNNNTPKNYLPLLSACHDLAWHYINKVIIKHKHVNSALIITLLLKVHAGNFKELINNKISPDKAINAAEKSIFLLISPIIISNILKWNKSEQIQLFIAGKYFLTAKQLADDVYDYKDDWKDGKRTFAHYKLNKLPSKKEIPAYYQQQAKNILYFCQKSKKELKKISSLKNRDCFNYFLKPLELNCLKTLSKLSAKF